MTKVPYAVLQIAVPIALLVGTVLASLPYAASRKEVYEASAKVWVQAQIPNTGADQPGGSGVYMPFMTFFNSPLLTAAEIIKSGEVIHQAGLLLDERFPGKTMPHGGEIAGGLSSLPIKDTDILVVKYAGPKPQIAADTLEAVLDAFVMISSRQSSASATKGRAFLEAQLGEAKAKLAAASAELLRFQEEHNVSNMQHDIQALMETAEKMRQRVKEDEIAISKNRRELQLLEAEFQNAPRTDDDSLLLALEKKLGEQRMELAEANQRLTEDHPYVTRLKESVDRTTSTLQQARGGSNRPTASRQHLSLQILGQRRTLTQLEVELRGHSTYLATLEQRLDKLPTEQVEWAELSRHKQAAAESVENMEKRLQSASLLETVSSGTTNIKIIDKPSIPMLPNGPSKTITVAVAALVGSVLAGAGFVALRQFNPTITSAAQVLAIIAWPLAGVLGFGAKAKQVQIERIRRAVKRNMNGKKRVVILSPNPAEGKSQLAAALAQAFASAGTKTILVDAAKKQGVLHTIFNVSQSDGLSDYIKAPDRVNPLKSVAENLALITTGSQDMPPNFLERRESIELFSKLEDQADLLIFDTAAAVQDPDGVALLEQGAVPLVIARLNSTSKNSLNNLYQQLLEAPSGMIVLSGASEEDLAVAVTKRVTTEAQTVAAEEQPVW